MHRLTAADLTPEQLRKLADEASTTPETIVKRLARLPVRRRAAERADAVLRKHGLLPAAKAAAS